MPARDRKSPATGGEAAGNRSDARRPHSIRFSDSEWDRIDEAATRRGFSAGELVRYGALAAAETTSGEAARGTRSTPSSAPHAMQ